MGSRSPSLRDLVTILYKPRETIRRILDGGPNRWTAEIVVLAFICASFGDPDIRHLGKLLPDLSLGPTLAFVALVLLLIATCWVLLVYAFAWAATLVGRVLDGRGAVADVRAALAWGLVPVIWSVVYRIPVWFYLSRLEINTRNPMQLSLDLLQQGGCSLALIVLALQFAFDIWILFVASSNVAEALGFETWKDLATIGIVAAVPVVVAVAAAIAFRA
jgi:hypothetical protein